MGTKQVRLDEDVYARIKDEKREDESFSDAIDRLTSDWSLAQWAQKYETDTEQSASHRELLDELDEIDKEKANEIAEQIE
jgi:predicted CopG family antitoxin